MKVYKSDSFSLKITSLRLPLLYCIGKQFTFTDWKVHNEYVISPGSLALMKRAPMYHLA